MPRKRLLDPIHPGEILLEEFMKPLGISINKLAREFRSEDGQTHSWAGDRQASTRSRGLTAPPPAPPA